ncbi:MAG: hypothetical protein AB7S77_13140 [Desulfatirhabdiaceae bacterium]
MSLNARPVFRRILTPWYDSDTTCLVVVAAMGAALVFGLAGMLTVFEIQSYRRFAWIPLLVSLLSGGVLVSTTIRMIIRHVQRRKEKLLMPETQKSME